MSGDLEPVVESTGGHAKPGEGSLRLRIRQQEILSELGVIALQGVPFDELLDATARFAAEGLEADFSKVMQWLPDRGLLVVAGVGWGPDVVGKAIVGTDLASPAGFALRTGKPVVSNHLENESRFRTPELLLRHGIRRAINVILQGDGAPFGVLEVDSRHPGEFSEHDLAFLQGAANLLGMAIERRRYEEQLRASLDHQQVLLKEVNHRVKNSLQLVASMLRLQASSADDDSVARLLNEAQARVMAVARAHERLYTSTDVSRLDLALYLKDVCEDLAQSVGSCQLIYEGPQQLHIETDRAIPLALVVAELATNSAKYAYPDETGGPIWVSLSHGPDDTVIVSVKDKGVGLPDGFEPIATRSLGMRLVRAFGQKLGGTIEFLNAHPGTEVRLTFPKTQLHDDSTSNGAR